MYSMHRYRDATDRNSKMTIVKNGGSPLRRSGTHHSRNTITEAVYFAKVAKEYLPIAVVSLSIDV